MSEINAGCVVVTKFVSANSKVFSSYIDYMNRDKAVRLENQDKFTIPEFSEEFDGYMDYMDNPKKTTDLFTANKDNLTSEDKENLKDVFKTSQNNGSLMWQTVISFDNKWLENNGLYNSETNELDDNKLKSYIRGGMAKMLEKEKMADTSIWSGAIHYNTDNIHIHIATVEPIPMRERIESGKFKGQIKGKFKQSSIDAGKSHIVNEIMNNKEVNSSINNTIRNNIVGNAKNTPFLKNRKLSKQVLNLYSKLPPDRRTWYYNMNAVKSLKEEIDNITRQYIEKYCADDFKELNEILEKQDKNFKEAYGKSTSSYKENKINELYTRMGNRLLTELREYDKELRYNNYKKFAKSKRGTSRKYKGSMQKLNLIQNLQSTKNLMKKLDKSMKKDYEHQHNLYIYETEIEQEK